MIQFKDGIHIHAVFSEDADASVALQSEIALQAVDLAERARAAGVIVCIEQLAKAPLAVGAHVDVVTVYPSRESTRPAPPASTWPPGFKSQIGELSRKDAANRARSVGVSNAIQRLRDSESPVERSKGKRAVRGLSRTGDDLEKTS